jgi:hypothetical protein
VGRTCRLTARPVGAFVIKGDEVTWRPAVDVDRMIPVGQLPPPRCSLWGRPCVRGSAAAKWHPDAITDVSTRSVRTVQYVPVPHITRHDALAG